MIYGSMLRLKSMIFLFTFCMVLVPLLSAALTYQNSNHLVSSTVTSKSDPDTVTIVVDILRFRSMTVDAVLPAFTFGVTIDGEPSLSEGGVYRANDCWFGELSASRTIAYNDEKPVDITITATEHSLLNRICDISPRSDLLNGRTVVLSYDLKRGAWTGDDHIGDVDGYGHASGFADGNERQQDAEIWFSVYQVEAGCADDRITYWEKMYMYALDPECCYSGQDV